MEECTYKIILVGNANVGKTTFFNKIKNNNYKLEKHSSTIGVDFSVFHKINNDINIKINLWDTAGQENRGGKLRDAYLKGADGVLLLYDVTERKTKDNILDWITQIKNVAPSVPVAVLGNKSDKFKDLQQSESVKLRDCTLQSTYENKNIRNFLISIKECFVYFCSVYL